MLRCTKKPTGSQASREGRHADRWTGRQESREECLGASRCVCVRVEVSCDMHMILLPFCCCFPAGTLNLMRDSLRLTEHFPDQAYTPVFLRDHSAPGGGVQVSPGKAWNRASVTTLHTAWLTLSSGWPGAVWAVAEGSGSRRPHRHSHHYSHLPPHSHHHHHHFATTSQLL